MAAGLLAACSGAPQPEVTRDEVAARTIVYLVRHAEKRPEKPDPALSAAGIVRADLLAVELADAGLTNIHSTDYIRTRETARPLARDLGLPVDLYDPGDLPGLAAQIKTMGGTHLVVGHSNTTPDMVAALGGEAGSPIDEVSEYDRLYVVTLSAAGVETELRRFGVRYQP